MRRITVTQERIIDLTRELLHAFYNREVTQFTHFLSDDFTWFGAFDFQCTNGKEEFLEAIKSELEFMAFTMDNEEYSIVARDRDTFVLCCKFDLYCKLPDGSSIETNTRLTVVWRHTEEGMQIAHVHGSNVENSPLLQPATGEKGQQSDFLDYFQQTSEVLLSKKIMFRTPRGEHIVLYERDIYYLKAEGQHTILYTKDDSFVVTGILRLHHDKLADFFHRVHKSYIVNTLYISSICRYKILLSNQVELPISKERFIPMRNFLRDNTSV